MDNLIKGEVYIEAFDSATNETTIYPPEFNDISLANLKQLFLLSNDGHTIEFPNRRAASYYNTNYVWKIGISEYDFEQNIMNYNLPYSETADSIDGSPTWTAKVLPGDKDFMTIIADIPQPLVNRYIRGVGVIAASAAGSNASSNGRTITNLKLSTACFQNTTTAIRITYRIYFDDVVPSVTHSNITDSYYKYIKAAFKKCSDGSNTTTAYNIFERFDIKVLSSFYDLSIPDTVKMSLPIEFMQTSNIKMTDVSLMPSVSSTKALYANGGIMSGSHTTLSDTTTMGTFFRNILIGGGSIGSPYVGFNRGLAYHPAIPTNSSPLQNLYKMNSSGTNFPFFNASYLSTMTGDITIGVGTWIQQAYPKLFRILITNSGSIGTATYKVQVMKFTAGFIQNTFCPREAILPQEGYNAGEDAYFRKSNYEKTTLSDIRTGGTTFRTPDDSKFIVAANCRRTSDAINVYNIETGDKLTLDSNTISGFNITAVSDVGVSGGFTFVSCANTGLWKIDSTFTSATRIIIAGVNDTKAYQVDVKSNGDIWVLFEGGLCQSTDLGSTWTIYNTTSPTIFSVTGITNSNWSNVTSMIIDPKHADDRILFVLGTGGGTNNAQGFAWWSRATATSSKPTNGIPFPVFSLSENLLRSDLIRCVNGVWFSNDVYSTDPPTSGLNGNLYVFTYGAASLNTTKQVGGNIRLTPRVYPATVAGVDGFFIGCGKNQYNVAGGIGLTSSFFVNGVNANSLSATITETSPEVEFFCKFGNTDISANMKIYQSGYNTSTGAYPLCYLKNSNMMLFGTSSIANNLHVAPLIIDPTATNYNTFKSACWEEYGWDGANWVLGNSNSKTCHAGAETLIDGLTISFTNGVSGTSFINTNFFSFVVGNGVMKDNLTTYTYSIPYYSEETELITAFSAYASLPDNKVLFVPSDPNTNSTAVGFGYSYKRGRITSCMTDRTFYSEQRANSSTTFVLKAKPIMVYSVSNTSGKYIGIADASTGSNLLTLRVTAANTIVVANSGGTTVATITNVSYTTELTMERIANNTIKVYDASIPSGLGSAATPYYTSAAINNAVVVKAYIPQASVNEMGWYDVTFTSTDTSVYRVICGDTGASSGLFNSKFVGISCTNLLADSKVYVNGVEQTIITNPLTIPTTGQVRIGAGGTLAFPNAVSGSTITGYVTAHYYP